MSAAVSIYIYHHIHHRVSHDFIYRVTLLRTDGVHCRESVVFKHNHCCTAAVHTVDPSPTPDLCLYKRKKFVAHGTISYVVFQNIPVVVTAVDPFSPSRFMPAQTSVKSEKNTVQYHPLCPNIVTAVLLLYILWTGVPPPTYACQYVKSLLYTVQYHMLCFKT